MKKRGREKETKEGGSEGGDECRGHGRMEMVRKGRRGGLVTQLLSNRSNTLTDIMQKDLLGFTGVMSKRHCIAGHEHWAT